MQGEVSTPTEPVEYPVSDGRPMGETDLHRDVMQEDAIEVLRDHFAPLADRCYVSGNNFVYYRRGDPRAVVSPDAYLVRGVPQRLRDTFKVWEEGGRRPSWVLEVTSRKTRLEDQGDKMSRYRDDLAVPEYFQFDPRAEWIREALRGYTLRDGVYQPLERDARGRIASAELGLELGAADGRLRFFRPGEDDPLPTRVERARQAEARVEQAEDELRRLRDELERLRGG